MRLMSGRNNGFPDGEIPTDDMIIKRLRFCGSFLRHHTEGKGSQRRVLSLLKTNSPMTQKALLDEMGVRASSLSELLGKLESKGYVIKTKSRADKRNFDVSITEDGLRALEEMQSQYASAMADLLVGLTADEKKQLADLLGKLNGLWLERIDDLPPSDRMHGHHRHQP